MFSTISGDSWTMLVGIILLLAFCIYEDVKNKAHLESDELEGNVFSERVARIRKIYHS